MYFVLARNRKAVTERQIAVRHPWLGWHRGDVTRLVILLTLLFAPRSTTAQACVPAEYRTKASFLTAVPSFIDWPEGAFTSAEAPFLVCVLGDFQFGTVLAELARNALPHARHIDVRWTRKDQELKNCHLLFVSKSEVKKYPKILYIVQGAGVLTIGETPDFLSAGGMLSLSFQSDSLRFEVNLVAANEAHLRVSSKLLALARRVVSGPVHRMDDQTGKRGALTSRGLYGAKFCISGNCVVIAQQAGRGGETMGKTRDMSEGSSINFPELLSRVDNDRELLLDLFAIFKDDFPRRLQALQDAVSHDDMKQIAMVSHTLKGMLLNLAVTRAAKGAAQLEELAHSGENSSVLKALAAFEMEVRGLLPEMEAYTTEVCR